MGVWLVTMPRVAGWSGSGPAACRLGLEGCLLDGALAEAMGVGYRDFLGGGDAGLALGVAMETKRRVAEILMVETGAGEDVGGVGEVVEHGEGRRLRRACRTFQHPANPAGNPRGLAQVMDPNRIRQPADAAWLDIDVTAALELQRGHRLPDPDDAFIESDRGTNLLL